MGVRLSDFFTIDERARMNGAHYYGSGYIGTSSITKEQSDELQAYLKAQGIEFEHVDATKPNESHIKGLSTHFIGVKEEAIAPLLGAEQAVDADGAHEAKVDLLHFFTPTRFTKAGGKEYYGPGYISTGPLTADEYANIRTALDAKGIPYEFKHVLDYRHCRPGEKDGYWIAVHESQLSALGYVPHTNVGQLQITKDRVGKQLDYFLAHGDEITMQDIAVEPGSRMIKIPSTPGFRPEEVRAFHEALAVAAGIELDYASRGVGSNPKAAEGSTHRYWYHEDLGLDEVKEKLLKAAEYARQADGLEPFREVVKEVASENAHEKKARAI